MKSIISWEGTSNQIKKLGGIFMEKNELFEMIMYHLMEEALKEEEKEIEEIFGELNEEQTLYLSDLRKKYFGLGMDIYVSVLNFSKVFRKMAGDVQWDCITIKMEVFKWHYILKGFLLKKPF